MHDVDGKGGVKMLELLLGWFLGVGSHCVFR